MKGSLELRLLECETILKFLETKSGGAMKEKVAAVQEILTRNSILLEGGDVFYFINKLFVYIG